MNDLSICRTPRTRKSGIELLKCSAILMIVISHILPCDPLSDYPAYINAAASTDNIRILLCIIFRHFGQIGNTIFIVCSSYFLADSSKVNPVKILTMIGNNWTISVLFLAVFCICGLQPTAEEVIKSLFPTLFNLCWFVTCYLLFYMVHPYLNVILNYLEKEKLLTVNIFTFTVYGILRQADLLNQYYNDLIGFIVIYFIVAYMKKYMTESALSMKLNITLALLSILCFIALISAVNFLGLHIEFFHNKSLLWMNFMNPFIIIFALSMFNIFSHMNFSSSIINYFSSLSLSIFIIHRNYFLKTYCIPHIFNRIYEYMTGNNLSYENNIALVSICLALIVLLLSIAAASVLRFTVERLVKSCADKIYKKFAPMASSLIKRLCTIR